MDKYTYIYIHIYIYTYVYIYIYVFICIHIQNRTIVPGPAGSTVNLGFQSDMGDRLEAPLKRTTGVLLSISKLQIKLYDLEPCCCLGEPYDLSTEPYDLSKELNSRGVEI